MMDNAFLAVNKEYYKLGLKSIELLILSQIAEFLRGGNDCYVTNTQFSEWFGESESTVKRALNNLEALGLIYRETTSNNAGSKRSRRRKLYIDEARINMSLANKEQGSNRQQPEFKNKNSKVQNKPIKEKIKNNNIKDNISIYLENIGIEYSETTKKALEAEVGKKLDERVIRDIVASNRATWTKIKDKEQGYKFATLRNIVKRDYDKTESKLEALRLEYKRQANEPEIDYSRLPKVNNFAKREDTSNLSEDLLEDEDDARNPSHVLSDELENYGIWDI